MVARGVGECSPTWKPDEQDAGDHKGPPNPSSSSLAPTGGDQHQALANLSTTSYNTRTPHWSERRLTRSSWLCTRLPSPSPA